MLFQWPGGWTVPEGPAQKRAISVCSAVRVVSARRADRLDLVEGLRELGRIERGRRVGAELVGRGDPERLDRGPLREGGRGEARGRGLPVVGPGAGDVRDHVGAPIVRALGEHAVGDQLAEGDAGILGWAVGNGGERRGQGRVQRGLLGGGHQAHEHTVRRHRGRRLLRGPPRGVTRDQVRGVAPLDAVHRVEDGAMDHGQCPGLGIRREPSNARRLHGHLVPLQHRVRGHQGPGLQGFDTRTRPVPRSLLLSHTILLGAIGPGVGSVTATP